MNWLKQAKATRQYEKVAKWLCLWLMFETPFQDSESSLRMMARLKPQPSPSLFHHQTKRPSKDSSRNTATGSSLEMPFLMLERLSVKWPSTKWLVEKQATLRRFPELFAQPLMNTASSN